MQFSFQSARFEPLSVERYRKHTGQIVVMQHILMPVFTGELDTQWIPYKLASGVLHLGRSPYSGHYRSFLIRDVASSGDESHELHPNQFVHTFLTDDGHDAAATSEEDLTLIQRNVYMLWYIRDITHTDFRAVDSCTACRSVLYGAR